LQAWPRRRSPRYAATRRGEFTSKP
jgi:hypothetical protein